MGRTFPTSVGTPVLLENLHSITGKVRPSRSSTSTGFKHCSRADDRYHCEDDQAPACKRLGRTAASVACPRLHRLSLSESRKRRRGLPERAGGNRHPARLRRQSPHRQRTPTSLTPAGRFGRTGLSPTAHLWLSGPWPRGHRSFVRWGAPPIAPSPAPDRALPAPRGEPAQARGGDDEAVTSAG